MFKTAAAKIAHNSTLPALGGNQDLRPLQDLITAEKAVLIGLQKLSVDYSKAAEALRTWGLNEGDDLGDILSASTTLLNHFSSALSQYATNGHAIRDQLKAIRTREEDLEELKRRKRTVVRKAEDADKKLSKMGPEHKNLSMQTDTLNRLRDEIRTMDSDILTEEAALGDFKRSATRAWMGLKFGGLLECCEKGSIAAEFGKMVVSEISEEMTQPGLPRSLYYGQSKTENLVAEANRCISEVVLSTVPSVGTRDRRQYNQELAVPQNAFSSNQGYPSSPIHENKPQPPPPMLDDNSQRTFGESIGSPSGMYGPSSANQPYGSTDQPPYSNSAFSPRLPAQIVEEGPERVTQTMDDFGMNSRSPGLIDSSNASGGRFATFPVKTRAPGSGGGFALQDPSVGSHQQDQSFSASVAEALEDRTSMETGQVTEGAHNFSQQNAYAGRNTGGSQIPWTGPAQTPYQFTSPPPARPAPNAGLPAVPGPTTSSSALPPPPPGAAPPNPWGGLNREDPSQGQGPTHSKVDTSHSEDALLAYMTSVQDDLHAEDEPSSPTVSSTLAAPSQSEEEQQRISRHVRFGEVEDVHEQMEKKKSLEKERQEQNQTLADGRSSMSAAPVPQNPTNADGTNGRPRSNSSSPNNKPSSHRVPPPTIFTDIDEQALDAAAARDVARELDSLNINQPQPSSPDSGKQQQQQQENETPSTPSRGRLPSIPGPGQSELQAGAGAGAVGAGVERDHSPLSPPHAPFASTRSVSPHRYAELNANAPPPAPYGVGGGYTPAQPYQDSGSGSGSYGSSPSNVSLGGYGGQPYGPTSATTPDRDPSSSSPSLSSSLPPRFQALNRSAENQQIPPRFQAAQQQQQNQIPPRFQAGGSPQIPSAVMNMSLSSSEPPAQQTERYPMPRPLGASSPYTRSNSSLNASAGSGSPVGAVGGSAAAGVGGPRTISAAAFKRPRNMTADSHNHSMGDQFMKKSLPSSPYPMRGDVGERNVSPTPNPNPTSANSMSNAPATSTSSGGPPTLPPIESGPQTELEEEYDYISAYVNNSNPNSPVQRDFGNTGVAPGGPLSSSLAHPRAQAQGGYSDGRFATDLSMEGGGRDGLR